MGEERQQAGLSFYSLQLPHEIRYCSTLEAREGRAQAAVQWGLRIGAGGVLGALTTQLETHLLPFKFPQWFKPPPRFLKSFSG